MASFARLLGDLVLDSQVRASGGFFGKPALTTFESQIKPILGIERSDGYGVGGVGFEVPIVDVSSSRSRSFFVRLPLISAFSFEEFSFIKQVVESVPITQDDGVHADHGECRFIVQSILTFIQIPYDIL